ncbi:MAG: glycosyltransferase [Calditrichia bacterium]
MKFLKFHNPKRFNATILTVKPSYFYSEDNTLAAELPKDLPVVYSGSLDPFRLLKLLHKGPSEDSPTNESGGLLRRIAGWLFIPDSRILWLPFAVAKIWWLNRSQPIDLLVASMPPFTAGLIARIAARMCNIPYVLDFRDAWTNNPYLPEPTKLHMRINKKLESSVLQHSTGTVFVNPYLSRYYRRHYHDITQKPTITLRNGFDPDDFKSIPEKPEAGLTTLCIMGTIYSQGNRPTTLIRALERLHIAEPDLAMRFRLRFIGKWVPEFYEEVQRSPIKDLVTWTPYLPHRIALQEAAKAQLLGLALESNLEGSADVTPGRIYEYLRMRRPILAMCNPNGDLADLIRNAKAGAVVDYSDVDGIAETLWNWIYSAESKAGYTFKGLDVFSRKTQAEELEEFILEVLQT